MNIFAGLYPAKNFEDEAKIWKNYATDYKPIIEFAKSEGLHFVATNVPRRYAAFTSRNGLEALSQLSTDAKQFLHLCQLNTIQLYQVTRIWDR